MYNIQHYFKSRLVAPELIVIVVKKKKKKRYDCKFIEHIVV